MKKTLGTVVTVCAIVALTVLCLVWGRWDITESQLATLKILLIISACSAAYCFAVGEITKNYSQMDKLWSLLPIAYTWIIAARGGMRLRPVIFAVIVTLWGARLTFNFARKGAYRLKFWQGNEDYRWSIVKSNPVFSHGVLWTLFDLFFISIYQNALILAICLPSLAASESSAPLTAFDAAAAVAAVLFLALETVADEYQWKFHQKKKELYGRAPFEEPGLPYSLGFNTTGPWSRMRHPNYLGEQGIWMSLYFFTLGALGASHGVFHPTAVGALLLILLFVGSSALGEKISSGKYPKYKEYQEKVYKYLPFGKYAPGK